MSTRARTVPVVPQEQVHEESMKLAEASKGIIPFMEYEVQRFEEESASFQAGEQDNAEFTPFRLRQGIYGQRQSDVQMIRVKIPGGILTPEALEALGTLAEDYAPPPEGPHHYPGKHPVSPRAFASVSRRTASSGSSGVEHAGSLRQHRS